MIDSRFFKSAPAISLEQAETISCGKLISQSDSTISVSKVAALNHEDLANAVIFITDKKLLKSHFKELPAVCLIPKGMEADLADTELIKSAVIVCDNPKASFALLAAYLHTSISDEHEIYQNPEVAIPSDSFIHQSVAMGAGVSIGSNVRIGPNSVIGTGVVIGDDCRIGSNVTITHALVGKGCQIFSGACIGQAGFGFTLHQGRQLRVPQLGRVVLHDEVEIGSCSTIDRGMLNDTVIGKQSKIDNLVQIAHNVQLGEKCAIASQTGISGSTVVGNGVMMGGQVGIVDHVNIGDGSIIFARSALMRDMPANEKWGGTPAKPARQWMKEVAALGKLTKK